MAKVWRWVNYYNWPGSARSVDLLSLIWREYKIEWDTHTHTESGYSCATSPLESVARGIQNSTLCSISPEASATSLLQCVFPRGFWDCGKVSISAVLQVQMMLLTAAATQPTNFGCLATSRLIQHVRCSNCGCIFEIFEMLFYDSIVKHFLFSFTIPSCRMGWWGEWTWNKLWSVLSRDRSVNWSASHLLYHSYIQLYIAPAVFNTVLWGRHWASIHLVMDFNCPLTNQVAHASTLGYGVDMIDPPNMDGFRS